jgi:ribose 5-phosphate isomerase RpiB
MNEKLLRLAQKIVDLYVETEFVKNERLQRLVQKIVHDENLNHHV